MFPMYVVPTTRTPNLYQIYLIARKEKSALCTNAQRISHAKKEI